MNFFSDDMRRNPFPVYDQMRRSSPVFHAPPPLDAWLIFDYDGVKRALNDHETFSSSVPAPRHWFIFFDPPRHTKLRALISQAFTPRVIGNLEPRIRQLTSELLQPGLEWGEMDLAADFSVPLPMKIIAGMIGIPDSEWVTYTRWSNGILKLSYARSGGDEAEQGMKEFAGVTAEMGQSLVGLIEQRRTAPRDDLLTKLVEAEVDGERLSHEEILGFFQLLILGGQETTTNLINNAILSFVENPGQLARLQAAPELLPSAIEEVLRYRSPLQWMMRTPRRDTELHGKTIPAGQLILAVIGSANRDPSHFSDPDRFDIARNPNPHLAFGHGIHFCLGAMLARMEARIALSHLFHSMSNIQLVDPVWQPRQALHVHGPTRLPIRFDRASHPAKAAA